ASEPAKPISELPAGIELDADAPRSADIVEEALIRQRARADEENIVVIDRREYARVPVDALVPAPDAGLQGLRNHLLERRIRHERVRQAARVVLVRTGQLHRRRSAVRLAVARVRRHA